MHICLTFIFIDRLLFTHEIWVLRGIALVQVIIIFIMVGVTMFQYKKLSGLVVLDLNRRRNARRIRRLQTTRL